MGTFRAPRLLWLETGATTQACKGWSGCAATLTGVPAFREKDALLPTEAGDFRPHLSHRPIG